MLKPVDKSKVIWSAFVAQEIILNEKKYQIF